jgi:hypothetical protein
VCRDPALQRMVVFVMTTPSTEENRMRAYNHNVAGSLLKNRLRESFLDSIKMLKHYWRVVAFPDDVRKKAVLF